MRSRMATSRTRSYSSTRPFTRRATRISTTLISCGITTVTRSRPSRSPTSTPTARSARRLARRSARAAVTRTTMAVCACVLGSTSPSPMSRRPSRRRRAPRSSCAPSSIRRFTRAPRSRTLCQRAIRPKPRWIIRRSCSTTRTGTFLCLWWSAANGTRCLMVISSTQLTSPCKTRMTRSTRERTTRTPASVWCFRTSTRTRIAAALP
mmetsp:Transcript_25278/g.58772  ORF Transcript_25278/g.58772 Transcript_25278/m.58772 type:complete len:207 (+) Transcript_25278:108-728(+)